MPNQAYTQNAAGVAFTEWLEAFKPKYPGMAGETLAWHAWVAAIEFAAPKARWPWDAPKSNGPTNPNDK